MRSPGHGLFSTRRIGLVKTDKSDDGENEAQTNKLACLVRFSVIMSTGRWSD
jgi:hypothetical protein